VYPYPAELEDNILKQADLALNMLKKVTPSYRIPQIPVLEKHPGPDARWVLCNLVDFPPARQLPPPPVSVPPAISYGLP
jgi:hypothetical protein